MKLLFDESLSHKLARLLDDLFFNSIVRDVGLEAADDPTGVAIRKGQWFDVGLKGRRYASA